MVWTTQHAMRVVGLWMREKRDELNLDYRFLRSLFWSDSTGSDSHGGVH